MKSESATEEQCEAQVWKRDTYRVSRGSPSGFRMHYNRCRCSRAAVGKGLCRQHQKKADAGWNVIQYERPRS